MLAAGQQLFDEHPAIFEADHTELVEKLLGWRVPPIVVIDHPAVFQLARHTVASDNYRNYVRSGLDRWHWHFSKRSLAFRIGHLTARPDVTNNGDRWMMPIHLGLDN